MSRMRRVGGLLRLLRGRSDMVKPRLFGWGFFVLFSG